MIYGWKAADIRAAIDRCERETEKMVQAGAKPEDIYRHRQGVETLAAWLMKAEAEEHGAGAVERGAES